MSVNVVHVEFSSMKVSYVDGSLVLLIFSVK